MEMDDAITFCQTDLKSTSFAAFEDMRRNEELCDLRITVQDKEITAHRVVVAAGIPYFRSTFVNVGHEEITLDDIDYNALESLIDFTYSSRITISNENVNHILLASKVLRLDKVFGACVEFISKRINSNNVWHVRTMAFALDIELLNENSNRYILANIENLAKSEEFLNLSASHLTEILFQTELNVRSEKVLFDAVIDWVKASPGERQASLPELMEKIHLVYLPIQYLSGKAASEEVIRTSAICRVMINEVQNYHFFPNTKSLFPNLKTKPRQFRGLYAICKDDSSICVSYCDFVNQMWHNVSRSAECGGFSAVAVDGKLYMFSKQQINVFDTKTLDWHVIFQEWDKTLDGAAFATIGNVVYGFGSYLKGFGNTIWYFDAMENKWHPKGRMNKWRYGAAAAGFLSDISCVYVTGGHNSLNGVEKYCPSTNQCTKVASMLTERVLHSAVSVSGKVYVCGGCDRTDFPEMYDPVADRWTFISSLNTGRQELQLVTCNGKLYALAGYTKSSPCVREIEIYNSENNKWEFSFAIPEGFWKALVL